jgi:hypothetical protein
LLLFPTIFLFIFYCHFTIHYSLSIIPLSVGLCTISLLFLLLSTSLLFIIHWSIGLQSIVYYSIFIIYYSIFRSIIIHYSIVHYSIIHYSTLHIHYSIRCLLFIPGWSITCLLVYWFYTCHSVGSYHTPYSIIFIVYYFPLSVLLFMVHSYSCLLAPLFQWSIIPVWFQFHIPYSILVISNCRMEWEPSLRELTFIFILYESIFIYLFIYLIVYVMYEPCLFVYVYLYL